MTKTVLFVEGDADLKFISDLVYYFYGKTLRSGIDIRKTGGKDNLIKKNFQENMEKQKQKKS